MNKKTSFLLHKDSLVILDEMTDEQAGKFFKAIYQYQITGTVPKLDFGIKMAMMPFINQFKRDNENWTKTQEERSLSGRIGNLKRWNPDLHKQFKAGKIILEDAENIANDRKESHSDISESLKSQRVANIPVSVNVSVNDSKINKKEKEIEQNFNTPPINIEDQKKEGGSKKHFQNDLKKINNEFKEFWNGYIPVKKTNGKVKEKGSQKTAKIAYAQALCNNYTSKQILQGSEKYLKNCQQNNILTCEVVTFLKEERFLNEYGNTVEAETTTDELNQSNIALLEYSQVLGIAKNFSDSTHEGYIFKNLITNAVVSDFGGVEKIAKIIREKDGYGIKTDLSYFKHDFQKTWIAFNKTNQTSNKVSGRLSKLIRESDWKGDGGAYEKNPIIEIPDLSLKKREQQL